MGNEFLTQAQLEEVHVAKDPWQYDTTRDDQNRKNILVSELPAKNYKNVLDIGCGQGFLTRDLPGEKVLGVDVSQQAIDHAKAFQTERLSFQQGNIFDLDKLLLPQTFDLIIITGVLYPPYIGDSHRLVYHIIDRLLPRGGTLVSVHISEWYSSRFPYLMLSEYAYSYREFYHKLEVYRK